MCEYDDDFDGPGPEDWMIIGPMAEEIAEEEQERRRLIDELDQENEETLGDLD
ncbi:MAG: hypothetical protein ABIK28_19970 [Planctomycetota bacterium]